MTMTTFDKVPAALRDSAPVQGKGRGFWQRVLDAVYEAQMRHAQRQIARLEPMLHREVRSPGNRCP